MSEEPFPGSPDDMMNTVAALRTRIAKLEEALGRMKYALEWIAEDQKTYRGYGNYDEEPRSGEDCQRIARAVLMELDR